MSVWKSVAIDAPAKLNLTLDVFPPRADGFHNLDSFVIPLFPADRLRVSVRDATERHIECLCTDATLPTDARNLAVRAAMVFCQEVRISAEIRIELEKNLPLQAGLGGGSSDAASVLLALQRLFPLLVSGATVREMAAQIGSDVPLFLSGGTVRMQGRGERITPIGESFSVQGVLVKPHSGVSTAVAYRLLDAVPNRVPGTATLRLLEAVAKKRIKSSGDLAPYLCNDFEAAILPAFSEVRAAHHALKVAGARAVLLCGSGAAVFGLAEDAAESQKLYESLAGQFPFVFQTADGTSKTP